MTAAPTTPALANDAQRGSHCGCSGLLQSIPQNHPKRILNNAIDNQDGIGQSRGMKTKNNQIEVQTKQLASDFCNWLEQEGYLGVSKSGLLQWAENCRPEILNSPATLRSVYETATLAWN